MAEGSDKGAVSGVLCECACVMGAAVAGDQLWGLGCEELSLAGWPNALAILRAPPHSSVNI